jgi:hypothetical protein
LPLCYHIQSLFKFEILSFFNGNSTPYSAMFLRREEPECHSLESLEIMMKFPTTLKKKTVAFLLASGHV